MNFSPGNLLLVVVTDKNKFLQGTVFSTKDNFVDENVLSRLKIILPVKMFS